MLCGCGRIGFDPLGGGSAAIDSTNGGGDGANGGGDGAIVGGDGASGSCPPVANCPIGSPTSIDNGTMLNAGAQAFFDRGLAGSCGGAGGAEAVVEVTTQTAGHYALSCTTAGPYVLYVRDNCCGGMELACTTMTAQGVTLAIAAAHTVVVFIDNVPLDGAVNLNILGMP
jgi:hypothetical protein